MGVDKSIDITPSQKELILGLLKQHLPNTTVWVYGSRVSQTARPNSDLDMVAFVNKDQQLAFYDLKEAFEESDLPFRVDIFIWDEVPEKFHKNIKEDYVVIQQAEELAWPIVTLGEYCTKIGSGATPRGGGSVYLEEGEVSLFRSQNIYNDGFKPNGLVCITGEAALKLKNVIVEKNDILLNITGDSVARVCLADEKYLPARVNQHVSIIRPKPKDFDSRFLRYSLVSPYMQSLLLTLASAGATRNALTKNMIETLDISKPPLNIQKAIAHILGSLDDKIELNRQMNATLESMAQALFKSWFVDFDPVIDNAIKAGNEIPDVFAVRAEQWKPSPTAPLPEREGSKNTHGKVGWRPLPSGEGWGEGFPSEFEYTEEMGWIPKGWVVGNILNIATLNSESWTKKNFPNNVRYVDLSNTKNGRINTIVSYAGTEAPSRARRILNVDDTIIGTVRPGNRSFAYVFEEGLTGSTGFAVMRPLEKFYRTFLYLKLTQDKTIEHFAHLADGGAYPAIRPEVVTNLESVLPTNNIFQYFDNYLNPLLKKIGTHEKESESLAKLRDTLLPKLISGELRIPDAEKLIKESV